MTVISRAVAWMLAAAALFLLLIAPNVNGPMLVLIWATLLGIARWVAAATRDRSHRMAIDAILLATCFLGAFWGGWFLIPAVMVFIVGDTRRIDGADKVPLGAEVIAAVASGASGFIALALLVAAQPAASNRGAGGDYQNLAEFQAAGPPDDRLDIVVVVWALLYAALVVTTMLHARTSSLLAFVGMCTSVVAVGVLAVLASFTAGWWFIPAVAFGAIACVAGWSRDRTASRGGPTTGAVKHGPA